jgi:L-asparaginase/Glu-tRNA(Gln) amidotransferase subunit D
LEALYGNIKILATGETIAGSSAFNTNTTDYKAGALGVETLINAVTDSLNPQKARILLMLALTQTKDVKQIQSYFNEY